MSKLNYYCTLLFIVLLSCSDDGIEVTEKDDGGFMVKVFDQSGNLKELKNYTSDTLLNGSFYSYYPDGTIKVEDNYINDVLHGKSIGYYPSGTVKREFTFDNGLLTGEAKFYYENGNIEQIDRYVSGKLNGISERFYEHGGLEVKTNYHNDRKVGEVSSYYPDGNIETYTFLDSAGNQVYYAGYDKEGSLSEEWGSLVIWSTFEKNEYRVGEEMLMETMVVIPPHFKNIGSVHFGEIGDPLNLNTLKNTQELSIDREHKGEIILTVKHRFKSWGHKKFALVLDIKNTQGFEKAMIRAYDWAANVNRRPL